MVTRTSRIDGVRRSLLATLEMALPITCGGCGTPGATWCSGCAHETRVATFPGGARQVCPTPCPVGFPPTWAATPYDAAARAALVAFKDSDRRDLVAVLAPMLADAMVWAMAHDLRLRALLTSGNGPVFVVPVPSSPSAVRRRGDAPLGLLTRAAVSQLVGSERELIISPALRLRRRVADQSGLDHRQRADNLDRAMQVLPRWLPSIRGVTCLLVDDVLTTGATLLEAARALRCAGASHVAAATVAATQRRGIPLAGTGTDEDGDRPRGPATGDNPWVSGIGVSPHPFVVYRSSMSPRVAVSTVEPGVDTVRRWAPRGSLGRVLSRGWCGG